LNPVWNETFVFETKNLTSPVIIRVYDRDVVSSDDFMGSGSINLNHRTINNNDEIKVELNDPAVDEQLGYLKFTIKVMPSTSHDQSDDNVDLNVKQYNNDKAKNPTCWDSVLTVTVLEAKNLPAMDHNGLSDPYCKFKLGSQKYKTKVIHKTLNPDWKEQFDMKLYNQKDKTLKVQVWDRDFPSTDDFIGECKIDLTKYNANHTYNLMLKLENTSMDITATLHLMLVISGLTGQEQDPSVSEHIMSNSNKNCYVRNLNKFCHVQLTKFILIT
jgi:Ca2+-dependent lipid-binding protein